jgi:hypothetical protein
LIAISGVIAPEIAIKADEPREREPPVSLTNRFHSGAPASQDCSVCSDFLS